MGELYGESEGYVGVGGDDASPDADDDFIAFCETRLQDAAAIRSSCVSPRVIGAQRPLSVAHIEELHAASVVPAHSGAIPHELWEELEGEHIVIYRKPTLLSEWFEF